MNMSRLFLESYCGEVMEKLLPVFVFGAYALVQTLYDCYPLLKLFQEHYSFELGFVFT